MAGQRYLSTAAPPPDSDKSKELATTQDNEKPRTLFGRINHLTKRLVTLTKETIHHYWLGSKLLALNTRTAFGIAMRLTQGHTLTVLISGPQQYRA